VIKESAKTEDKGQELTQSDRQDVKGRSRGRRHVYRSWGRNSTGPVLSPVLAKVWVISNIDKQLKTFIEI